MVENSGYRGTLTSKHGEVQFDLNYRATTRGKFQMRFVQMFPQQMMKLACDQTLSGQCFRVYIWCTANIDFQSYKLIDHFEVAQSLGIVRSTVTKALNQLLERGALEQIGKKPRQQWRLSPEFGFYGTANQHNKIMRQREAENQQADGSVIDIKTGEILEDTPA